MQRFRVGLPPSTCCAAPATAVLLLCALRGSVSDVGLLRWSLPPPREDVPGAGSGGQRAPSRSQAYPKLAVVVVICNGTDWRHKVGADQIERARGVQRTVASVSNLSTVLLTAGFDQASPDFRRLRRRFARHVDVAMPDLKFRRRKYHDGLFSLNGGLQRREDGRCTTLKFHAWRLTEYDGIAVMDSDLCIKEDPYPSLAKFVDETDAGILTSPLLASWEMAKRSFQGVNTMIHYIRPSAVLFNVLRDKAMTGEFIGYTNTEQDVYDTVFAPSRGWFANDTHAHSGIRLPRHAHRRPCYARR